MFNLFGKKESKATPPNPGTTSLPARLQAGAKAINQRLIAGLKNEKGVHFESFATLLGALGGFSCQVSVCEQQRAGTLPQPGSGKSVWVVANDANGKKYYFGDALNLPLVEGPLSIWSLIVGILQHLGAEKPDVGSIFQHVSATVGTETFGIPRIPDDHRPGDIPLNYLKVVWPHIFPLVKEISANPVDWPVIFGLAMQEAIMMGKDMVKPTLAATILMECAVPMSKVDLPELNVSPFESSPAA
jgi:hypothetical protein